MYPRFTLLGQVLAEKALSKGLAKKKGDRDGDGDGDGDRDVDREIERRPKKIASESHVINISPIGVTSPNYSSSSGATAARRKFKPISEYPHARKLDRILIITLHEPLFFG